MYKLNQCMIYFEILKFIKLFDGVVTVIDSNNNHGIPL